ncbi:MAG: radical SAM protein [Candidatus Heimdallarchaeota archaeon]|nr:radical SAM protein [Candidatus Heimdallarchaeota archaeon]
MRCIHCGSTAGIPRKNELTLNESLSVVDELVELDCKEVTLIGGEVFLYPKWDEIARKLTDYGIEVSIITNGFLMGQKQLDEIKNAKLDLVGISVDGMRENHNKIRNHKQAFDRILKAFDLLNEEKIPKGVVTTIFDFNFTDLEQLYGLFIKSNISVWQLQLANPMGNMADNNGFVFDPKKMSHLTNFIKEKRYGHELLVYAGDNIGYYDHNEAYIRSMPNRLSVWQGCQAGLSVIGIDSIGNVKGCESIYSDDFIEGNVREQSLIEIWNDEDNFAYNRKFHPDNLQGKCKGCEMGAICRGGCRGSNVFCTGNLFENYFCQYNATKRN